MRFSTLRFFRQSITPRPLINTLKYFRILFRICQAIYENVLIPRNVVFCIEFVCKSCAMPHSAGP
jgi:hypothetical protein